jgi:ceramide glucosyltransferase
MKASAEQMTLFELLLAAFCFSATLLHLMSIGLAIYRCRPRLTQLAAPRHAPAVCILRPLCGVDNFEQHTLRSGFELDYPNYELIFCCSEDTDPAAIIVRKLMAHYSHVKAKLLIGRNCASPNPKLNNLIKSWSHIHSHWVIFADSNVYMPADYIQRLLASWRGNTGIVCSPPIGSLPSGFWAELECAFLNTYQARWQYAADSLGFGFAQGKTMVWRRRDLAKAGGIGALASEIAEDAAATKVVRFLGLRPTLVDAPFVQPLGRRFSRQVWERQARWSRLRRITFPSIFVLEILTGSVLPLLAGVYTADQLGLSVPAAFLVLSLVWFGSEAVLAYIGRWHLSALSPLAWMLRDLLLPVLWVQAWLSDDFHWRGNEVRGSRRQIVVSEV